MSRLLINLRDVPLDEQEEIHALLQAEQIDYHETSAGVFGLSVAALWVNDEAQFRHARQLLDAYALERQQRMRAQREAEQAVGGTRTMLGMILERPLRFIGCFLLLVGIVYLSTVHFWNAAARL